MNASLFTFKIPFLYSNSFFSNCKKNSKEIYLKGTFSTEFAYTLVSQHEVISNSRNQYATHSVHEKSMEGTFFLPYET